MKGTLKKILVFAAIYFSGVLVGNMNSSLDNLDKVEEVHTIIDNISDENLSGDEKRIFDLYNDIIENMLAGKFGNNEEIFNDACDLLNEYYDGHFLYSAGEEAGFLGGGVSAIKQISELEERPYVGIFHVEEENSVINYYPMDELSVIMTEDVNYVINKYDGSSVVKAGNIDVATETEISEDVTDFVAIPFKEYLLTFKDELTEEEQIMLETDANYGVILISNELFNKQDENGIEIEKPKGSNNSIASEKPKVYINKAVF